MSLNVWMLSDVWLFFEFECLNTWMFEYLDVRIFGCLNMWMFEYLDVWMFQYLDVWMFLDSLMFCLKQCIVIE